MIAKVEITYNGREQLTKLDDAALGAIGHIIEVPDPERRKMSWAWPSELLLDLETDGPVLIEHGVTFEVKNFKGTMRMSAVLPQGGKTTVYVQVPHIGLLMINEVKVLDDACTEALQSELNNGWRILCVCPPNAQRRPDYVLGRTRQENER